MPFLPDWLPNIHPIIVHFPIAILICAIGVDVFSLFYRRKALAHAAMGLLGAGALSLVAAYFSGQRAADSVLLPPLANPVLNEHADLALWTMLFFLVYAILRAITASRGLLEHRAAAFAVVAFSLFGLYLLYETGEHGGRLVFEHGVGVAASQGGDGGPVMAAESMTAPGDSLILSPAGAWRWDPGEGAASVLADGMRWLSGSAAGAGAFAVVDPGRGMVLQLNPAGAPLMLVAGDSLVSVQMDLAVNLDAFEGSFRLIHHARDVDNYDFLGWSRDGLALGRVRGGEAEIMDRKAAAHSGWVMLSVVGDGRHFRGYVDKQLVVHGHGAEPPAGLTGLAITGRGMILLDRIVVTALK